ncbi:MAG: hypothetical protein K9N51_02560 [Candidatus Pacebacteria bacterium]|nr:hypothetical protein [Candidatus Paceibacterota bacterium]
MRGFSQRKGVFRERKEPSAQRLVSEAFHGLRGADAGTLLTYYIGACPFVLFLLYFVADMSRSAFAAQRCGWESLCLAVLFVWMKAWHVFFTVRMVDRRRNVPVTRVSLRRLVRVAPAQGALHCTAAVVLPMAFLAALPFAWAYAFYHHVTVCGLTGEARMGAVRSEAWKHALEWPRQNHIIVFVISIFALFIFVNLYHAFVFLPLVLQRFLGVESIFTGGVHHFFNTTLVSVVIAMTYLCIDPLVKTVYALRTFYARAASDGADLLSDIRRLRGAAVVLTVFLCLLSAGSQAGRLTVARSGGIRSSELSVPPSQPRESTRASGVQPPVAALVSNQNEISGLREKSRRLDKEISAVIRRPEYAWRLPRSGVPRETGFVADALDLMGAWLRDFSRWIREWVLRLSDWWRRLFGRDEDAGAGGTWGFGDWRTVSWIVLISAVVTLAAFGIVWWLRRRKQARKGIVDAETVAAPEAPDVSDESVSAADMPDDKWERLAHDLLQQGRNRLALRALFFSMLAFLARQRLVSLATFKSNQDYLRELMPLAHALPTVPDAFLRNTARLERVWYGRHHATKQVVEAFVEDMKRIKGHSQSSSSDDRQ